MHSLHYTIPRELQYIESKQLTGLGQSVSAELISVLITRQSVVSITGGLYETYRVYCDENILTSSAV